MKKQRLIRSIEFLCPTGDDTGSEALVIDFFSTIPLSLSLGIRFLFWIFWWFPIFALGRLATLGKLSETERESYFAWWEYNRFYLFREALHSVKFVALVARVGREWELPR